MTADYYKRPDETTQEALALAVENIKEDRQPEDLLFQVMLDWGVDLALAITTETIAGKEVFFVASGSSENENAALAACFATDLDDDFSKALAKKHPCARSSAMPPSRTTPPASMWSNSSKPSAPAPKCAPSDSWPSLTADLSSKGLSKSPHPRPLSCRFKFKIGGNVC